MNALQGKKNANENKPSQIITQFPHTHSECIQPNNSYRLYTLVNVTYVDIYEWYINLYITHASLLRHAMKICECMGRCYMSVKCSFKR